MKRAIFVLSLFSLTLFLFAQEKGVTDLKTIDENKDAIKKQGDKTVGQAKEENASENKKVEQSSPAQKSIFIEEKSASHPIGKSELLSERKEYEPEFGGLFLWTFLVIGLIIGCYFLFRKVAAGSRLFGSFNVINILAKKQISPKHTIYLVEIGKKIILLGATKDGIAPLGEFTNQDEVAVIRAKCLGVKGSSEEEIFNRQLKENLSKYEKDDASQARDTSGFQNTLEEMKKTVDNWKAE